MVIHDHDPVYEEMDQDYLRTVRFHLKIAWRKRKRHGI
jgi:hypothetical protein